ncbi:hypothetical protein D6825_02210 [Candidatus Woesearchaeota archaeon]|nr:MAG: hypothetical protein D6825_02210 [Candidatus Woesearchaeota archaeon]
MKKRIADFKSVLSPLERDVLNVLWPKKRLRVKEVHEKLACNVALSSVAVILDRLHSRGIVKRDVEPGRGGVRYIYYPCKNKAEFEKSIVEKTVNKLIDAFGPVAISYFNERFRR